MLAAGQVATYADDGLLGPDLRVVHIGLSVDTTMLSGNADMFAIMKVTLSCANPRAHNEFALTARDMLRLATIDWARSLGLGEVTGSLAAGKRADVIVILVDAANLGVLCRAG